MNMMTKVDLEGFVEIECPNFNLEKMKELKLSMSPKLKIPIFLRKKSFNYVIEYYNQSDECTSINCGLIDQRNGRCAYNSKPCAYLHLSKA